MTNEEAIEKLRTEKEVLDERYGNYEASEHLDMAIKALEKQVPKKPIMEDWSPAKCPSCGAELSDDLGDGYYKHYYGLKVCDCGQQLKWD